MKILVLLVALCAGSCALANETVAIEEVSADPCVDADRGIQLALNLCEAQKLEQAEQALADVLAQIRQRYAGEKLFLVRLEKAQLAWAQLRDADLEARFPVDEGDQPSQVWGSSYGMVAARFLADMTRARTTYLQQWLDGIDEGDLSAGSIHWKQQP